jgi:hypothetical protein
MQTLPCGVFLFVQILFRLWVMKGIYIDEQDARVIDEHYALVYAPRRSRNRFAENTVEVVESEQLARENANPDKKIYAAKVIGPSRSSEGLRVYYLSEWLE